MIHALPGMGADKRMFPTPWTGLPNFEAHDWVRHTGERSLAEMARTMCEVHGIRDGDTLVGASLGGMVACEITKIRRIPLVFLVGSAIRREEVSSLLGALHPLAQVAPIDWIRFSAGKLPMELAQMFANVEATFVRAACRAIFEWEGLGPTSSKILRLHGRHDLIIPPPEHVDLLLDGGHMISISHAQACVDYVGEECSKSRAG